MRNLIRILLRLEYALNLPGLLYLSTIFPKTRCQPREVSSSQRRGFDDPGTDYGHAQNISLKLREQVVGRSPAINAQFIYCDARILFHDLQDIRYLKGDALECRARNMSSPGAPSDPGDRAARILILVRRAQSSKRRHE